MKKSNKIPTILGILILVFGLVAGVFLINSTQIFKLGAQAESIPQNVRITNITDNSLTVTWTTDLSSTGFIKWGKTASSVNKVVLEENGDKSLVHSVNLSGLDANADVFFTINSNGKDYENDNIPWQGKTLAASIPQASSLIASGMILSPDEVTPASAIVYLSINGISLSSLTSKEGSWVIPVSLFVSPIEDSTAIEVSVNGGSLGSSQGVIYPKAIKSTPVMVLGKTYDFRTANIEDITNSPESSLSIPESVKVSSRFEVTKGATPSASTNVSLDSLDDREIINTNDPEFFGTGPKKTEIEIQVESELQSAKVTVANSGKWSWSPPKNLEPGEHTITIKWKDASGVLRTLTRTFIVQASEGPAFVSTPSGTPITTSTPRSTATATSIASTRPTSTATVSASLTPTPTLRPTPETGSLTPTILLFIMGMGLLISSYFVWKHAES